MAEMMVLLGLEVGCGGSKASQPYEGRAMDL